MKLIYFLSKRRWLQYLFVVVLFFIIAIAEGAAYWIGGVAVVLVLYWGVLDLSGTIKAIQKRIEENK